MSLSLFRLATVVQQDTKVLEHLSGVRIEFQHMPALLDCLGAPAGPVQWQGERSVRSTVVGLRSRRLAKAIRSFIGLLLIEKDATQLVQRFGLVWFQRQGALEVLLCRVASPSFPSAKIAPIEL